MRTFASFFLVFVFVMTLGACAGKPAPAHDATAVTPGAPPASGRLPADVRPLHYRLHLDLDPDQGQYRGNVEIDLALDRPRGVLWLNGRGLGLKAPVLRRADGTTLEGRVRDVGGDGLFAVAFPSEVGPGKVTLGITFYGRATDGCTGLNRHKRGGDWYLLSQLEATYARDVFPGFDEPGFKAPFDVSITAPERHVAISNGREVGAAKVGRHKRTVFATTPPLPTYLLAFAVGPFDLVEAPPIAPNELRPRPLALRGVARRGEGARLRWALEQTPPLLDDLERYLGAAYPFDKLDLITSACDRPSAMENPGAVVFSERLLSIDPARSTDEDRRAAASTIAHELAHMWFGNSVTPQWWSDLWLNESFATWLGSSAVRRRRPADRADVGLAIGARGALMLDELAAARPIRHTMETEAEIGGGFNGMTYAKGAAVLGMVERLAGHDAFRASLRDYLARYRGGSASADDLLGALEAGAGRDAADALRSFLLQPGAPWLEARLDCAGREPALRLRQSRYVALGRRPEAARTWVVPVCARYADGGAVREACAVLREAEGSLALPAASCPAWVMPNAGGAGYYRWLLPVADLRRVAAAPALSEPERISFVDAVHAAWGRAALTAPDALALLAPLVNDPEPEIASGPMRLLSRGRSWLAAEPAARRNLEHYAASLYATRLAALNATAPPAPVSAAAAAEPAERAQARREVLEFLALTARDVDLRALVAAPGRAHLLAKPGGAPPEGLALDVAVADGGAPLFDAALAHFRAARPGAGWRYLRALAAATQPELVARARALAFDKGVLHGEVYPFLSALLENDDRRDETWAWVLANLPALQKRLPNRHIPWVPALASGLCDARQADELAAHFAGPLASPEVAERVSNTADGIRACAAQRAAMGDDLRAFFAGPRAPPR